MCWVGHHFHTTKLTYSSFHWNWLVKSKFIPSFCKKTLSSIFHLFDLTLKHCAVKFFTCLYIGVIYYFIEGYYLVRRDKNVFTPIFSMGESIFAKYLFTILSWLYSNFVFRFNISMFFNKITISSGGRRGS